LQTFWFYSKLSKVKKSELPAIWHQVARRTMIIKEGILIISLKAIENHQDMVQVLKLNSVLILNYKGVKLKKEGRYRTIWYACF
jgi:hypothetical protein